MNAKQGLKTNPDVQAMEDALCLSFLEHEFSTFSAKHDDDKVLAGVDGEALRLNPPLEFSIVPRGLRLLVPATTCSPKRRRRAFDPTTPTRLWGVATGRGEVGKQDQ